MNNLSKSLLKLGFKNNFGSNYYELVTEPNSKYVKERMVVVCTNTELVMFLRHFGIDLKSSNN